MRRSAFCIRKFTNIIRFPFQYRLKAFLHICTPVIIVTVTMSFQDCLTTHQSINLSWALFFSIGDHVILNIVIPPPSIGSSSIRPLGHIATLSNIFAHTKIERNLFKEGKLPLQNVISHFQFQLKIQDKMQF